MNQTSPVHLRPFNTFAVDAICHQFYEPESLEQLKSIVNELPPHFYILGEGSNTLFVDETTPVIVKPNFRGIDIVESKVAFRITAAASENWHQLVLHCIEAGIGGLENLAFIPGSVGAAPVQNIGAYGLELADYCKCVYWFNFEDQQEYMLSSKECKFGYRDSIFKNELKNKGVITKVCIELPKKWQARLNYSGLSDLPVSVSPKQVMDKVIEIRKAKLPDPQVLPNAGSFFKNPIVEQVTFEKIKTQYSNIPNYPVTDGKVKLAAGWLIEQAGLKGVKLEGCGVHEKQALVLINFSSQYGQSIINLAKLVTKRVSDQFNIQLEPEVRLISKIKEVSFEEVTFHG